MQQERRGEPKYAVPPGGSQAHREVSVARLCVCVVCVCVCVCSCVMCVMEG